MLSGELYFAVATERSRPTASRLPAPNYRFPVTSYQFPAKLLGSGFFAGKETGSRAFYA